MCVCVCVCVYLNLKMTGVKEPDKQFTTRQFSAFKIVGYIATFLKYGKPKNSIKKRHTHINTHTHVQLKQFHEIVFTLTMPYAL